MRLRIEQSTRDVTWHKRLAVACVACLWAALNVLHSARAAEGLGADLSLVQGKSANGVAQVGLAIDLKPGWHTYWRYPGDSGVPPEIDTTGSTNIAAVSVDYPAPRRFVDGTDQTIGYEGSVMLVLTARLIDPMKSSTLAVEARLGVCKQICVPLDERLTLTLDAAKPADPGDIARVADATRRLPTRATGTGTLSVVDLRRDASVKPQLLTFRISGPPSQLSDVFVEGPTGWALPLPTRGIETTDSTTWSVVLDGLPPETRPDGASLTFTIVGREAATTQVVKLP
jgi:DsbC/DsbD-like thiol-disulfide interchange protein